MTHAPATAEATIGAQCKALFSKTSTILLQLTQRRDLDALCTPRIWPLTVDVVLTSSSTSTRGPVNFSHSVATNSSERGVLR